jgi:hypothetical protein
VHADEPDQTHALPFLTVHAEMLDQVDDLERLSQDLPRRQDLKAQYDDEPSEHNLNVVEKAIQMPFPEDDSRHTPRPPANPATMRTEWIEG